MRNSIVLVGLISGCLVGCTLDPKKTGQASAPIVGGTLDNGDPAVGRATFYGVSPIDHYFYTAICTATLISPTKVLTAAHCLYALQPVGVTIPDFGDVCFYSDASNCSSHVIQTDIAHSVADPIWNPDWLSNNHFEGHDLAVLTLMNPVPDIQPLPINFKSDPAEADPSGNPNMRIVGVGLPDPSARKYEITVPLDRIIAGTISNSGFVTDHGDSGGPMFLRFAGVEKIAGVTSFTAHGGGYDGSYGGRLDASYGSFVSQQLCGTCAVGSHCEAGQCVIDCVPTTCQAQSKNCGDIQDGCGGTLTCGTCSGVQTCGGGGMPNVCGCIFDPDACIGKCGIRTDICGIQVDCGGCAQGQTCGGGGIVNVCGCTSDPNVCTGKCGMLTDNCGQPIDCGACAPPPPPPAAENPPTTAPPIPSYPEVLPPHPPVPVLVQPAESAPDAVSPTTLVGGCTLSPTAARSPWANLLTPALLALILRRRRRSS